MWKPNDRSAYPRIRESDDHVGANPVRLAMSKPFERRAIRQGTNISVVRVENGSGDSEPLLSYAAADRIGLDRILLKWPIDLCRQLKTKGTADELLVAAPGPTLEKENRAKSLISLLSPMSVVKAASTVPI
jgi:hypothetical protein